MGKLFISYVHEDKPFVAAFAKALVDQGHDVWWDQALAAGGEYRHQIQLALDAAEVVIMVWSAQSRLSRFVADEADQALSKGKLVPVVIDRARPALGFGTIHTIDLGSWSGETDDASSAELGRVIAEVAHAPAADPCSRRGAWPKRPGGADVRVDPERCPRGLQTCRGSGSDPSGHRMVRQ
jgi:hypothetical protein